MGLSAQNTITGIRPKEKTNYTKVINNTISLGFQRQSHKSLEYCCLVFDIRISDLLTIQFRLSFKDKGHKSLEYYCLVIQGESKKTDTFDIQMNNKGVSFF